MDTLFIRKLNRSKYLLLLFLPCLLYLILFKYRPMWGVTIAFRDFKEFVGVAGSKWVGLHFFELFFSTPDAFKLLRNTFLLGVFGLVWGFPVPIIFALLMNEVRSLKVKKFVQTTSYLPYFISQVVIAGMVINFLSPTSGVINELIKFFGMEPVNFMNDAGWFRTIYIASDIWQQTGWNAIIYIAALSSIDVQLYDAAHIDGCNKAQKILYVDLPGIVPTIITLFILNTGRVLNIGFEKVLLLYNPSIYETADIISTYVYRQGLEFHNYSYATAINLFQSVISLFFLIVCNRMAKRFSETSLW